MMFEEVMIQIGVQLNLLQKIQKIAGRLGGRQPPPMMFEEVMIQIGVQ